jgi:methylated-DNA-[protein]-cysteine S-methyltransferase
VIFATIPFNIVNLMEKTIFNIIFEDIIVFLLMLVKNIRLAIEYNIWVSTPHESCHIEKISTPEIGDMWVHATNLGVKHILWEEPHKKWLALNSQFIDKSAETKFTKLCIAQLKGYLKGEREIFNIPIDITGWTDFQFAVREVVSIIPFGETMSYKDVEAILGKQNIARAVGQANASNPISIVIPCHRLIGMNGSLRGYGGGIDKKKWLIRHEYKNTNRK